MNADMENVLQRQINLMQVTALVVSCDAWKNLKLATKICNTASVFGSCCGGYGAEVCPKTLEKNTQPFWM